MATSDKCRFVCKGTAERHRLRQKATGARLRSGWQRPEAVRRESASQLPEHGRREPELPTHGDDGRHEIAARACLDVAILLVATEDPDRKERDQRPAEQPDGRQHRLFNLVPERGVPLKQVAPAGIEIPRADDADLAGVLQPDSGTLVDDLTPFEDPSLVVTA